MSFEFNYITLVGFLAQMLFFSRFAVQLFLSERAKASLSPTLFWQISFVACFLMIAYGWLRNDFSIIEGQLLAYFIYIRNLQLKDAWRRLPWIARRIFIFVPMLAIFYSIIHFNDIILPLLQNPSIPVSWLLLGTIGQTIFASRFIYQWIYSEVKKESLFPLGFWIISIIGSSIIIVYAIFAKDIVLLIGQGFGLLVYSRNCYLRSLAKKAAKTENI